MVKIFLKNIWNKVTLMVSMFILSTVSSTLYAQDLIPLPAKTDTADTLVELNTGRRGFVLTTARNSSVKIENGMIHKDSLIIRLIKMEDGTLVYDTLADSKRRILKSNYKSVKETNYIANDSAAIARLSEFEWVSDTQNMRHVKRSYPESIDYYEHPDHPGFQVYSPDYEPYILKNGELVYICTAPSISYDYKTIVHAVMRKQYESNMYNVNRESKGVQAALKSHFGNKVGPSTITAKEWEISERYIEQLEADFEKYVELFENEEGRIRDVLLRRIDNTHFEYSFGKVRVIVEFYLKNTDLHHRFNVTSVFLEEDL